MKEKPSILVVDDQEQNIELMEAFLVPEGCAIIKAASGEEALQILSGAGIDLVLLDVMMPGMDGFEVIRRIRRIEANRLLPIILVTALKEKEERIQGIDAGCDDFISKPVDKMELLARVRSLLKVKAYNDLSANYRKELEAEVALSNAAMQKTLQGSIKILIDILSLINPEAYNTSIDAKKTTRSLCTRLNIANAWEYEIAVMLSQTGLSTMPPELIGKYRQDQVFTKKEQMLFNTHPAIAKNIIGNIPKLENIAEAIGHQMTDYPDTLKIGNKQTASMARMLKLTFDFATVKKSLAGNEAGAFSVFQEKKHKYDPLMFGALEAELGSAAKNYIINEISPRNIKYGMILADDIIDFDKQTLILPKGTEITSLFLMRLSNFLKSGRKISKIKILNLVDTKSGPV